MWFEVLTFIFGISFGYFHHGREDYTGLLRNGALTGAVLGILFVLLSLSLVPGGLSLDAGFLGVFGVFLVIILFVIIFIVGAFIGDRLERVKKK